MIWIPGGSFTMGAKPHYPEEGPPQVVHVDGFWISNHEITNLEYLEFVQTTENSTSESSNSDRVDDQEQGGVVFEPEEIQPRVSEPWWQWQTKANWRNPTGNQEISEQDLLYPVVQVTLQEATAYANALGLDLPTEIQWEFAAREQWNSPAQPVDSDGRYLANVFQGLFPVSDQGLDGFPRRSPVGCFSANDHGLFDMVGNVWEWTLDRSPKDPNLAIIKGGSYLCSSTYCARYRTSAREFMSVDNRAEHLGFRVVDNTRPPPH